MNEVSSVSQREWTDANCKGQLVITKVYHQVLPLFLIKLMSTDDLGIHRGILLQYELPLNFVHHEGLTNVFSSV
jgi:hypothetical protein